MITPPEWDDLDSRIATVQAALRGWRTPDRVEAADELSGIRGDLAALRYLAEHRDDPPPVAPPTPNTYDGVLEDNLPQIETRAYQAAGFTGNICDQCGGSRMVRSGTCELCNDCGTTTGCS